MSKEKGEVYYITPTGKKLRTRHEIMNNLHDDLTINNFTLAKEAIGAAPDDEIIRPAKIYNYSRRSNLDPVIADATPPLLGKRVPKPKMPKGASPPPANFPSTPTSSSNSVPQFTPNHNKSFSSKENMLDVSKASSPTRKPAIKGKMK
jgi:Methyl-CpG binding domain